MIADSMAFPTRRAERGASFDWSGAVRFRWARSAGIIARQLGKLIDGSPVAALLDPLYSATKGAWPPLAMFKALLLSIWYDLPT